MVDFGHWKFSVVFMKALPLIAALAFVIFTFLPQSALAQLSTSPASPEELEAQYTLAIENRTSGILNELNIQDSAKEKRVHDAIISFYRALRARDAVIDMYLEATGKDTSYKNPDRAPHSQAMTGPIRELFIGTLSSYLTPEQVETVKDKLTYNKVEVTYDAYNAILPNLKEAEKNHIRQQLVQAREEAYTGGSSQEKTAIFESHKSRINEFLNSNGYDVAKATEEWEKRQAQTASTSSGQPSGQ